LFERVGEKKRDDFRRALPAERRATLWGKKRLPSLHLGREAEGSKCRSRTRRIVVNGRTVEVLIGFALLSRLGKPLERVDFLVWSTTAVPNKIARVDTTSWEVQTFPKMQV
jgi:hypothetical protein